MRSKLVPIILALAVCGMVAVTGSALAAGAATKLTIHEENGDFFGKVKSDNPNCVEGRKVKLLKQTGKEQDPKVDEKIASDTADANGAWSTGNTGVKKGKYYARAGRISGCKAANSETVRVRR